MLDCRTTSADERVEASASMLDCSKVSATVARLVSTATALAISAATAVFALSGVKYWLLPSCKSSVENDAKNASAPIFFNESELTS